MAATNEDIRWAIRTIRERAVDITLWRAYYDGNHRAPWATPKWNAAFADLFGRFRDNLCPAIINAKADRIQLLGITSTESDQIAAAVQVVWERETLESRQGEVTKNALKDGDAFVIIWPDGEGLARWYIQRGDRIACKYATEPQGEIEVAAKVWPVEEWSLDGKSLWRLNLYYPDRTERFVTPAEIEGASLNEEPGKWEEYTPDTTEEYDEMGEEAVGASFSVPNPYGEVPVFPFPNNADTGAYGVSELKDVIPLQDALNKSVADMLVGEEFVAWPQRVLIGVDVDVDENGDPTGKEQKQALDRILAIANPNAKAAEWSGADLTKFIATQDSFRAEMARISQTPLHYLLLAGDFPSGEALDAAEAPLLAQVDDRILSWKSPYSRAMSFSLRVENTTHDPKAINANFKPTRRVDMAKLAEELRMKKELGVPDDQLWKEMGYDEEQIKDFADQKAERAVAMQAAFDSGGGGLNPEATNGRLPAAVAGE